MSYGATTFPQTTYNKSFAPGQLGQLYTAGANPGCIKGALPADAIISPGDLLEKLYDSNNLAYCVRPAQSASGSLQALAGVAIYKAMRQPVYPPYNQTWNPGYQVGDMVEFLRKGKIYAKWLSKDGATAQVPYSSPNYAHSSTASVPSVAIQGAFTDKSTSTTAGSEVDACPTGIQLQEDQTVWAGFSGSAPYTSICLVELNLP